MNDFPIDLNSREDINPMSLSSEEKSTALEKWNSKPLVKNNGIVAIDQNKVEPVDKKTLLFYKVAAFLGVASILFMAIVFGLAFYKQGGELFPAAVCAPNITAAACPSCPGLPAIPACPSQACNCPTANVTVYSYPTIRIINQTQ